MLEAAPGSTVVNLSTFEVVKKIKNPKGCFLFEMMSVVSIDSKFLTILFSQPALNKRIGRIATRITPAIHLVVAANVRALIFCLNLLSSDTLVLRTHAFMQANTQGTRRFRARLCVYGCVGVGSQ